jgi:hypothetical protein
MNIRQCSNYVSERALNSYFRHDKLNQFVLNCTTGILISTERAYPGVLANLPVFGPTERSSVSYRHRRRRQ